MPVKINSEVRAYANCDHVIVAWKFEQNIPGCIGFALVKRLNNEPESSADPIPNRIGFAGQSPQPGEQRPSTEWPIQRFNWTDFDVKSGDTVSYMVIPMLMNGNDVQKDTANASDWSSPVTIGSIAGTGMESYFNRGIISSQFMSRQIAAIKAKDKTATLDSTLKDETSLVTQFLGGALARQIFKELDAVVNDSTLSIYGSLYELNDENVITRFISIGSRMNLVLANGAFGSGAKSDENKDVRARLKKTKVNVSDRIVKSGHFAHNKFLVFCKNGTPYKVWTGSTNLTTNGLYTQVNNAVIINDPVVAKWYYDEWNQIKKAGNDYTADFIAYNTKGNGNSGNTATWFAPVSGEVDLNAAKKLIDGAQNGILFLFFNPGPADTLYNEIVDMIGKKPGLFVHGIMNQDPGGTKNPLVFIHKSNPNSHSTDFDTILPTNIKDEFAAWAKEISGKMVVIHSKVVVIDPFGDNPVVITGSHNLGPKASKQNDDNLNILSGNKDLARQYAVNILSVYDHFHWRYSVTHQAKGSKVYEGLTTDPNWMPGYLAGSNINELHFLFGQPAPAASSAPAAPAAPPAPAAAPASPKSPAKKTSVKKAAKKAAPAKAAKKAAPKKAPAKKAPAKKAPAKKAPAKKTAVKKAAVKKTTAKKTVVKKTAPKKAIKKAVKKSISKKAPVKKSAPRKAVTKKPVKSKK